MVTSDLDNPRTSSASAGPAAASLPDDRFLLAFAQALLVPFTGDAPDPGQAGRVAGFLMAQRQALPHALPYAMRFACVLMDLSTLPTRGRRFRALALADRVRVVAGWRVSRVSSLRNFVKFHEVFASYLHYAAHHPDAGGMA